MTSCWRRLRMDGRHGLWSLRSLLKAKAIKIDNLLYLYQAVTNKIIKQNDMQT